MKGYIAHKIAIFSLLIVSILGCENVVVVDLPEHEPRLVVNSFLDPDLNWNVHVSTSTDIFDQTNAGDRKLTDADVLVYENGELLDTLHYMQFMFIDSNQNEHKAWGYLSLQHKPKAGHDYRVEAHHRDYPVASGFASVPNVPEGFVKDAEFNFDVFRDPFDGDIVSQLSLDLENPNPGHHYYGIRAWVTFEYRDADGNIIADNTEIDFQKTWEGGKVEEKFMGESFFKINDGGNSANQQIDLPGELNGDLNPQDYPELQFIGVYIELKSCTQAYYEYLVQLKLQLESQENDIPLFGGEPVTVHSNINGGYGIIAAFAKARISLPL